jgi:tRNA A-37 threonylcarbamoyl transferase component Bud32
MKSGFETKGGNEPAEGRPVFVPPPVADIAKLFPQLEIVGLLGQGGMGAVYKARQPRLDRWVALKILAPEKQNDPQFAERFEREARTLASLAHPNIVAIYDFGEAQGHFYLVMEFVDGMTLRQLLQAGTMAPAEALKIVPKICDALQFAHERGVIHRDIKPENILLDRQGQVKIADFGIAKILELAPGDLSLTGARDVVGTPHYMAPEQVEKPQTVDSRADIFSLGVVFYEMLTGELPLGKFQPPSQKVQIDVRLDDVVLRALAKEPERRYQQVSEVKSNVETISHTKPNPTKRTMKTITLLAVGLIAIVCVFAIALTYEYVHEQKILHAAKPATAPASPLNARQNTLREKFTERMTRDKATYSPEQLKQAEQLYQVANKKFGTPEAKESLLAMIQKYPDLDRTGCAVLYLAQMSHGDDRAQYLQDCTSKYDGCFYGDGVQVGAFARFLLIQDYQSQGAPDKAEALINEIKAKYPDAIDHSGRLLLDSLNASPK